MELIALSRKEIETLPTVAMPAIAICIAYPTGRLHNVEARPGGFLAVHHTRFHDCDEAGAWAFPDNKPDPVARFPMTRGQAVDIIDFVDYWLNVEQIQAIVAACQGGVSRSRGVLAGLAAIYGWDDRDVYAEGQPNAWCKTLIVREDRYRRWSL